MTKGKVVVGLAMGLAVLLADSAAIRRRIVSLAGLTAVIAGGWKIAGLAGAVMCAALGAVTAWLVGMAALARRNKTVWV